MKPTTFIASVILSTCALLAAGLVAFAQDAKTDDATSDSQQSAESTDIAAGHSNHGEAFNEGPRQAAVLIDGTGNISFPVTTNSELAQEFFEQGVGQLHGFWYYESERSFRQVAKLDPDCAIAYWGMAMSNVEDEDRAIGFSREAWLRRDKASEREKLYIDALAVFYGTNEKPPEKKPDAKPDAKKPERKRLNRDQEIKRRRRYVKDLEKIIAKFPDDLEVKALLLNQLWLDTRHGVPIHSKAMNEALVAQILAANPAHPAHHYRIHLWDETDTAEQVLSSASRAGQSAPGVAHQWHMGGHIFDRLKRFSDTAYQQEASARVDHAHMMRYRVMPYQIHNYAHNNEWLIRSLNHVGRIADALALAKNMIELPRHPKSNHLAKGGSGAAYGRRRLLETLARAELWDHTIALGDQMYLEPGDRRRDRFDRSYALARAHLLRASGGDLARGREYLTELEQMVEEERADRLDAADAAEEKAIAEKKKEKEIHDAMVDALRSGTRMVQRFEKSVGEIEGLVLYAERDYDGAFAKLEESKYPALDRSRLHLNAGQGEAALKTAREAEKKDPHLFVRAQLAAAAWAAGERDEAQKVFEDVRTDSAQLDLDVAAFARLAPIAKACGHEDDWRIEYVEPADVGDRPLLASLGPFRWSPVPAPNWQVEGGQEQPVSLADYRGKSVLVIFFLGFGCVHCVEQLGSIRPLTDKFAEAGISIVTIGTDSKEQIEDSLKHGGGFPFPILSDRAGTVFKDYRAWDDFEDMPLHGTFLVDAAGLIRWQDISFEPFMESEFLLKECRRLLALPTPDTAAANGSPTAAPKVGESEAASNEAPGG